MVVVWDADGVGVLRCEVSCDMVVWWYVFRAVSFAQAVGQKAIFRR